MVADSDQELRCYKLLARSIAPKFDKGARDQREVADLLQTVNDYPDWKNRVGKPAKPVVAPASIWEELALWQKFDQKFFPEVGAGNYTSLPVPAYREGFNWPVVAARGIAANTLVARMHKEFGVYNVISDLDTVHSDRLSVSRSYIALFRDRREADEEMWRKSADMLSMECIPGITLLERLRFGFFYWFKTGTHLDAESTTLCAGSRSRIGGVPCVCWDRTDDGVYVGWCSPGNLRDGTRTRVAVF